MSQMRTHRPHANNESLALMANCARDGSYRNIIQRRPKKTFHIARKGQ